MMKNILEYNISLLILDILFYSIADVQLVNLTQLTGSGILHAKFIVGMYL